MPRCKAEKLEGPIRNLIDAILRGEDWKSGLEAAAELHGRELVTCVVQRILYWLQVQRGYTDAKSQVVVERAKSWLAAQSFQVK